MGADRFALLLRDVKRDADVTPLLKDRILAQFTDPFLVSGKVFHIMAKVGLAFFPSDGKDAETLLRNAESALWNTKKAGERYLFYAPSMNAHVAKKLGIENRLREALARKQFVLYYQPKINLTTGRVEGLEALIRWNDLDKSLFPPDKFIPLLEEIGIMVEVGEWALIKASAAFRAWSKEGLNPPRIAVNVSAMQLRRPDFVKSVFQAIQASPSGDCGIDLEITESMMMEDIAASTSKLRVLRDAGIPISMDDFGTGYSCLAYLTKLPLSSLKIDRSFAFAMTKEPNDLALVSSIITLAHGLNLKVIAEGVETHEQADLLRLLKCDQIQGFLISRPVPEATIKRWLVEKAQDPTAEFQGWIRD